MPLPLNHSTNLDSIGLAAPVEVRTAVPLLLNIAASGGTPTCAVAPPNPTPFRNVRRDTAVFRDIRILPNLTVLLEPRQPPPAHPEKSAMSLEQAAIPGT